MKNKISKEKLITKLKFKIYTSFPFFGPLTRKMKIIYITNEEKEKMDYDFDFKAGTDGKYIYLSNSFFESSFKEQLGIILHELLHVAYKHPLRFDLIKRKESVPMLFNCVTDLRINEILLNAKKYDNGKAVNANLNLPKDGVNIGTAKDLIASIPIIPGKEEQFYNVFIDLDKSSEEAYSILKSLLDMSKMSTKVSNSGEGDEKNSEDENGDGGNNNDDNDSNSKRNDPFNNYKDKDLMSPKGKNNKPLNEEERRKMEEEIDDLVIRGSVEEATKNKGDQTGWWTKQFPWLTKAHEVRWDKLVKNYVRKSLKRRRSWQKLHKKSYFTNSVIPGYRKRKKLTVVIGIDVSGSIADRHYEKFIGEIYNLVTKYDAYLTIAQFDTQIKNEFKINKKKDAKELTIRKGYGGTSYKDFFDKYGKERVKVIFTDGYGDQNNIEKYKNVIWVTNDVVDFPFGRIVKIKENID